MRAKHLRPAQWEQEMKQRGMGRLLLALPEGELVTGVTSLDNHVYVLHAKSSEQEQVDVYDIITYRLLRCVTIPGLSSIDDIVACGHHRCAYISDQSHDYTQSNTTRCHSDAVVCR